MLDASSHKRKPCSPLTSPAAPVGPHLHHREAAKSLIEPRSSGGQTPPSSPAPCAFSGLNMLSPQWLDPSPSQVTPRLCPGVSLPSVMPRSEAPPQAGSDIWERDGACTSDPGLYQSPQIQLEQLSRPAAKRLTYHDLNNISLSTQQP